MLRSQLPPCPFCRIPSLLRTTPSIPPQWQQVRTIMRTQKRRPARMELSAKITQRTPKPLSRTSNSPRRGSDDPFTHLNRTEAPAGLKRPPNSRFSSRNNNGSAREEADLRFLNQANTSASERPQRPSAETGPRKPFGPRGSASRNSNRREGGFHALKMQRALDSVAYEKRSTIKSRIAAIDSFTQFRFLPSLLQSIEPELFPGQVDIAPTPVQRVAIPALLDSKETQKAKSDDIFDDMRYNMKQFLVAAETGSGKTLAYLLPAIDALKRADEAEQKQAQRKAEEDAKKSAEWKPNSPFELEAPVLSNHASTVARPKVVILVPTSELVTQVGNIAKPLSRATKFKAALISAAYTPRVIRNRLFNPAGVDMVISTPHLLASIAEESPNILSRVTHLIVDEADSLFDSGFSPLTSVIIEKASPSLKQLILCSATITRKLDSYVTKRFPEMERLVTPNLHAIPRRVQLGVVNVNEDPYRGNKDVACADAIWTIGRSAAEHDGPDKEVIDVKRIIVFVNEREKATELAEFLGTKGIEAEALHRDTAARMSEILAPFKGGYKETIPRSEMAKEPNYRPATAKTQTSRGRLANTKVVVCTDLGSRGIDTLACRHVILYDVPHTSIDFIHRLGRLGRMGRRGRAVVLVGRGDRADIVKEVRDAMFTGKALI